MLKKLPLLMLWVLFYFTLNIFIEDIQSQETELPPLTELGPYGVRTQQMTLIDDSRDNWRLSVFIMYPADKTQGTFVMDGSPLMLDAPPDMSGAPYPLILYSHGHGSNSGELLNVYAHLASYGYVVAVTTHHDTLPVSLELVDRPLDMMMMMDELALIEDGDLSGMIDADNIGLMGLSSGGTTSLQMLGLLNDPTHFISYCADQPEMTSLDCERWIFEDITAYRDKLGLDDLPDGRWQPFGDDRVRAVLTMAPCYFPLTSEDMLAEVTTPIMILHGTHDSSCDYEGNAVRTYTYLGTDDRYLITLIRGIHSDVITPQIPEHFATAFFGYYLHGNEAYMPYLTHEGIPPWNLPSLAWGPYEE